MIPDISEFSYGFALTNELVGWTTLKTAPVFPSLIEEGRAGGGYDVKLDMPGVPLYLQFKRAHYMTRRTAKELRKDKNKLNLPFHRFYVTESRSSNQHTLLLELDNGTNEVFYAAPRFNTITEINAAWQANAVASRSIFVRPRDIGVLDDKLHHVAYDANRTFLCSQPKPIAAVSAAQLDKILKAKLEHEDRALKDMLPELSSNADEALKRALSRISQKKRTRTQQREYQRVLALVESQPAPVAPLRQVPGRDAGALAEPRQQLRELADQALKLFDAQLVMVQQAD